VEVLVKANEQILIGINQCSERLGELFYGGTQKNMEWIIAQCRICQEEAANTAPKTVQPIISQRCLDRVYLDLMDFTTEPDGEYEYVLQVR
jgi:hypothetical protein